MAILRGTITTQPVRIDISIDVSDDLYRSIQGFKWAWEMNDDQFIDAMTEHGRVPLTEERIRKYIFTH